MIFGAGYVGLVQAAGLASTGNDVYLVDISKERIEKLRRGECPIFEPGLPELLKSGHSKGYLHFLDFDSALYREKSISSEIFFIAVGTPQAEDGQADLSYLFSVAEMLLNVGQSLNEKIVVVKSTVPVGTCDRLDQFFQSKGFHPTVVSNPEFLKQGAAVQDFLKPDRVIVGTRDDSAKKVLSFLYKPFMLKRERMVVMERRSAELVKYACNSFLATKISFINEMARLSERVGANIHEIREGMISDSRIGDQFLFPGIGYGGSCLPKDTKALMAQGRSLGIAMQIVEAVDAVNRLQKDWVFDHLARIFENRWTDRKVCLWGLAFKPNTDDLRDAPSLHLLRALLVRGVSIRAHDPVAAGQLRSIFSSELSLGRLSTFSDPYEAATGCDALAVMTEWQEYRSPNLKRLASLLAGKLILDGRDIYDPEMLRSAGFAYYGVGLPVLE